MFSRKLTKSIAAGAAAIAVSRRFLRDHQRNVQQQSSRRRRRLIRCQQQPRWR